jgi:hypothetical protein
MRLVDDLYTRVNALLVAPPDLHPFQASVYAVTEHGAFPTYLVLQRHLSSATLIIIQATRTNSGP